MTTEEPPLSASATATATSSPLDKPLHLLTEDDISQITREQCRRFLSQKGMRRPSWNKSQAIQQVIMLKALIEPSPESENCSRKLNRIHRQQESPTTRVQKGTSGDTEVSVSAEEWVPGQRNGIDQADIVVRGDNDFVPRRITGVPDEEKGQMTIFYSGKVNVYDDIPPEKAWTLLQLAASPLQFPQETLADGNVTTSSLRCHLQAPSIKTRTDSSAMLLPTLQTVESSASRKASVQRYLEKRKDRFKSKKKADSPTCASLDAYVSHQMQNQNQKEQPTRNSAFPLPPGRSPDSTNRFS